MRRSFFFAGVGVFFSGLALLIVSFFVGAGTGQIDLKIANKATIMTCAYKVYGNPEAVNGKYWLTKLTLKNSGDGPIRDLKVSYQIPDYVTWTSPQTCPDVNPGETVVDSFYPRLPASVTKISSLTPSSVEIKIEYDDGTGPKSRIERRDFQFRGVHEIEYSSLPTSEQVGFYDWNDNAELNSAWVTEEDEAVRTFYTKISEVAGGFGTMGTAKDVEQLARSTYNYMVAQGMTYSGTKGLVEQQGDDIKLVQSMRLPRDLIYGNSGLCVELAQLWASIAINAGAKCYLVIIPGHCFPVLESTEDGVLLPVEATGIGGGFKGGNLGGAMTFEQAVEVATKNYKAVRSGKIPGIIIDVLDYRNKGIRPPELGDIDRPALITLLDKRAAEHHKAAPVTPDGRNPVVVNNGEKVAWQDSRNRMSMEFPAGWKSNPNEAARMKQLGFPGYELMMGDPQTGAFFQVISFDGATNTASVATQMINSYGPTSKSKPPTMEKIGGRDAIIIPFGCFTKTGIDLRMQMAIIKIPSGIVVINGGAGAAQIEAAAPSLVGVKESVKFTE